MSNSKMAGKKAKNTVLPWLEFGIGLCFLLGQWLRPAAIASVILLGMFSGAILINLLRGRKIACRCFGEIGKAQISWWSVARNGALAFLALALVFARSPYYLTLEGWLGAKPPVPGDPPPAEFVPVVVLAWAGVMLYLLGISAGQVARHIAQAEDGPMKHMPEQRFLQRRLLFSHINGAAVDAAGTHNYKKSE